ncbi:MULTISPECIES: fimbrial protein [Pantoea]|jgi:type 1 fimbria pilin|uniref:fimbrial protein n=1 Tax=Pantoea TaxID=53335 RepID=UPI001F21A572|nr:MULTISPECIES: fimbrial protein [Pantoea]UIL53202.1 type 1 fimbrial protein [Pantoea agglomerans]
MRIFLISLFSLAVLSQFSVANAAGQGHGKVQMQGMIIDTPCAISAESLDQSIDLDVLPVSTIVNEGVGPAQPFTIKLSNCSLESSLKNKNDWSKFSIAFDGNTTNGDLFSTSGEANGVGLQISDKAGNIAVPGQAMPENSITPGSMTINYNLRLMADQNTVRAGNFQSTIRFRMDYY